MTSTEVYLLPLNDDGSPQVAGEYIYLAPSSRDPITLRFEIEGTSSIARHGSLWVNIPEKGTPFRRDKFREFKYVSSKIGTVFPPLNQVNWLLLTCIQIESRL